MSKRLLFSFVVPGAPMGKQRPKASVVAGHAHIYTPGPTQRYESLVRSEYERAACDSSGAIPCPFPGALEIEVRAYFPLGKSDYTPKGKISKSGERKLSGELMPTKKPDFDNIAKIAVDALNGIAFVDDSQICVAYVSKEYSASPRVEISAYAIVRE